MGKRYDQLDLDDRIEISRLHAAGKSRREIGHLMGRDASTIGRELRRNSLPRGEYKPASADRIALSRRRRLSKIERLSRLRDHVSDHLAMGWSPEQIAGRLRLEGSEHEISHESIYRFITAQKSTRRSSTASWRGPRRHADGATSSAGANLSPAAAPSTSDHKPSIGVGNSATGRATSCSSAPSAATF